MNAQVLQVKHSSEIQQVFQFGFFFNIKLWISFFVGDIMREVGLGNFGQRH